MGSSPFVSFCARICESLPYNLNVPYFAEEISIADFAILGWAWRHPRHQIDLAEFPHVRDWYQRMMAREATQRGFAVALK
ncbi:MAG: hypothetical protein EBW88_06065 [Betaproteobacteria bacterium]|nr:hypothetical protein [Betaproteobacteria bacterium]